MGGKFKFQAQDSFLEYFFERLGDLKNKSHFLKKATFSLRGNATAISLVCHLRPCEFWQYIHTLPANNSIEMFCLTICSQFVHESNTF